MRIIVLLVFVLWSSVIHAQLDTSAISSKLSQLKDKLGKDVAFVLYKDGKVAYKKEMGKYNIKTQEDIGASSQWLTAALVMTYVQEGKLSLDDKVSKYIPLFEKYYKGYITIRHCLTHFTGIKSEQGIKLFQKSKFKTLDEEVADYASKKDIQTNAGTEFRYSNMGFNIAGRVIEVITKKTFDRLMQDRITKPLAMKSTTFTNENYNDALDPSTGAKSTAGDYINFLAMLLNKGTFNNKQILSESSVATLLSMQVEASQVKYAPKIAEGLSYGMGDWVLETNSKGVATAVASPSLGGTWPMIDVCRQYACIVFTKEQSGEQTRQLYMDIKGTIDEGINAACD